MRQGFRNKLLIGIFITLLLVLVNSNEAQAVREGESRVLIDNYSVSGDEIVPGSEFDLVLTLENTSKIYDVRSVIVDIKDKDNQGMIYPTYGNTNQGYIGILYAGTKSTITIHMRASEGITVSNILANATISYDDDYYTAEKSFVSMITLPVKLSGDLIFAPTTMPTDAIVGTKQRVEIEYTNTGIEAINNVVLHVVTQHTNEDGTITEPKELTSNLYSISGGTKNTSEIYLDSSNAGEETVSIYFTYTDESGEAFETDTQKYKVTISHVGTATVTNDSVQTVSGEDNILTLVLLGSIAVIMLILVVLLKNRRK